MSNGIEVFLYKFKEIVTHGRGLDILPRVIKNDTVINLGLTRQNIIDIILDLSIQDYCKGPEADHDKSSGQIWFFGKKIDEIEIYIKLKIANVNNIDIAKCISFHESEFPLRYPRKHAGSKGRQK